VFREEGTIVLYFLFGISEAVIQEENTSTGYTRRALSQYTEAFPILEAALAAAPRFPPAASLQRFSASAVTS